MALPGIWTFAQSGTTKSRTLREIPFFSQQPRVTGMTAEDEAIESPVRYAGSMFQRHVNGLRLASAPAAE